MTGSDERNGTNPLLTDDDWQAIADKADRIVPGKLIAVIQERIALALTRGVTVVPPAMTAVEIVDLAQDFRVVERPSSYEPYETFDYVGFARAILARAASVKGNAND